MCTLVQVQNCLSAVSNRTIDDFNGDLITGFMPLYEPQNVWNTDGNCSACFVKPDPSQALDLTWHDSTQKSEGDSPSSVTIQFTGTAIYLFCIIPNTVPNSATTVSLAFTIDDTSHGGYNHAPDASSDILYAVPVLSAEALSNEPHTLVARTAEPSLFIFDYAMYT
ncbi:hypothetical protein B0H17DRAFT_952938 [Mycena rosella]|uniref:Uncharacterized protein n=1 Tax=Mycena rosella TaxID=1033263 RepID=A0AAD7CTY9_MYCRO|nr:hypothetical protein B0H17DRAFT_952938 [Mycena rosella]